MDYPKIFGYVATCLSTCFYCSLSLPFFDVIRCKRNYEYTPIAFINTIYVDSVAWYIYADKILCDQLKLCNTIGACCTLLLIIIYLVYELKKYLIDSILNALILILGTLVLHKGLTIVVEDAQMVGKICICTKIISFLIPIILTCRVIKEKNYKLIPIYSTVINVLVSSTWLGFGICINLISQIIPNALGVFFSILNTSLWIYFYINRDKEKEKSEKEDEVELVEK